MDIYKKIEPYLMNVKKPSRYIGGEMGEIIKDKSKTAVRFAFCFPDVYDIGMSHIGMKILYSLQNEMDGVWCERVFAPWPDFEDVMRQNNIPLYGLESMDPVNEFDFVGFTLQYEMSYTNILNMLDLAKIPLYSKERPEEGCPLVVAGGPCACNPEPLADFIDIFLLGDGEELNPELINLYKSMKLEGNLSRSRFLVEASKIEGVYVPAFYEPKYNFGGTIEKIEHAPFVPEKVKKRVIKDMTAAYFPQNFVVPFCEIVHDRAVCEILRGCIRGCRFCQAGFIYRPFREKSADKVTEQAVELCQNTGYDRLSLSSLSTSDHSEINKILSDILDYTEKNKISVSLPSMRADAFTDDILEKIKAVSKTGLTFAAEAGSQRLRNVINKNLSDEDIYNSCKTAFDGGYDAVKLYFMIGLPTETDSDIEAMAQMAENIVDMFYNNPNRPKRRHIHISMSVATFVPKPFTPFQYEPQVTMEEADRKKKLLLSSIKSKKNIKVSFMDSPVSVIEAVLARGDRRLCKVLEEVWKMGGKFESWEEYFDISRWERAFEISGLEPSFYASSHREYGECHPWSHLDFGVSEKFLILENKRAQKAVTTPDCRTRCSGCGMQKVCRLAKEQS